MNHTNNNLMVNLTNHDLEPPLKSMLSKGLKFVPTPDKTCLKTIINSFKQFRRSMYVHYYFRNSPNDHPNPFKTTSTWTPPLHDNPNLLLYICSVAKSIHQTFSHNSHDQLTSNLNEEELNFLATYNIHNQKYVIKPADKGCAIVIWSTTDYENEALSQLNDNKYYERIVISKQTTKITKYVKDLYKFGDIDYKTLQYLIPPSPPRTPIFYLLPKIHKPNDQMTDALNEKGGEETTDHLLTDMQSFDSQENFPDLKKGIKLPKSPLQWSTANNFFKLTFSNYPTTPQDLNNNINTMTTVIYKYFCNNFGSIDNNSHNTKFVEKY